MDEILDAVDMASDAGLEDAFAWVLRALGVIAILAGVGVWLFTDLSLLVPVALIVLGVVLVAIPTILLELVEVAG